MFRWHAMSNPQRMLPGSAACALGTISVRDEQTRKPDSWEAP